MAKPNAFVRPAPRWASTSTKSKSSDANGLPSKLNMATLATDLNAVTLICHLAQHFFCKNENPRGALSSLHPHEHCTYRPDFPCTLLIARVLEIYALCFQRHDQGEYKKKLHMPSQEWRDILPKHLFTPIHLLVINYPTSMALYLWWKKGGNRPARAPSVASMLRLDCHSPLRTGSAGQVSGGKAASGQQGRSNVHVNVPPPHADR